MENTKLLKAYCSKSKRHLGLEIKQFGSMWKIVNVIELTEEEARIVVSEVKQASFETNDNLIACTKCGNRKVNGCSCAKKSNRCSDKKKYNFQCIYCEELKIDYSLPRRSDVSGRNGDTVTLAQGKEVKIVTFSNVEWKRFDKIQMHQNGDEFHEPKVHVLANQENIEFHGYNISAMDEGVYYIIGKNDDFEIECDVDTTKISPHPGGYFYVTFGAITAQINQNGGTFFLNKKEVAKVGAKFKMRLSLTEGGKFTVHIDDRKAGELYQKVCEDLRIVFGFAHEAHYCHMLSHAYVKGIKMTQGVSQQQ